MRLLREGIHFLREIYEKKYLIYELTRRDFTQRYIGSFLGLLWAFLEPLAMIMIMWFVFSLGFKVQPSGDVPFVTYLFTGMIAYNFFQDTMGASSGIMNSYAFMVKKMNFRVSILPIVKINSAFILHLVFIVIVMGVLIASGIRPSWFWFQAIYYIVAFVFLILGLSWLLSALGVFVKDVTHVMAVLLRMLFWLTPIFWNIDMLPERFHVFIKLNLLFYIVQGYRESFIYQVPFWTHPYYACYFWGFSLIIFSLGVLVFKRLRPHFADVL